MRRNYHWKLGGEIITGNYEEKLSQLKKERRRRREREKIERQRVDIRQM